jgi:RNA recognition motif-containing protein
LQGAPAADSSAATPQRLLRGHYLLPAAAGSSISRRGLLKKASVWMTTIYVGNLSFNATEQDVRSLFERHGKVDSVKLIMDRETGKPRGFGFVDMEQNEAQAAIQALNGHQMNGRPLRVNEAQERPQRPRQGGGPFRR